MELNTLIKLYTWLGYTVFQGTDSKWWLRNSTGQSWQYNTAAHTKYTEAFWAVLFDTDKLSVNADELIEKISRKEEGLTVQEVLGQNGDWWDVIITSARPKLFIDIKASSPTRVVALERAITTFVERCL